MKKTALVTGGTDGIGKAIALALARADCDVLIVGQQEEKGIRACHELRELSGNPDVHFTQADLSLVQGANGLADEVIRRWPHLSYLVHCAGIVRGKRVLTPEGLESNFAVNYLSRFVLSARLLPLLRASSSVNGTGHILVVSGAATNGTIHFDDVNLTKNFGTLRAVLQCCQANDALTIELAARMVASGARVTINCLKVGVVKTGIRSGFPTWMKWVVPLIMDPLLALTPSDVATSAIALLQDPAFEHTTGALFQLIRTFKPVAIPKSLRDPAIRGRLWQLSERLVAERAYTASALVSAL